MSKRILVVDDEPDILQVVSFRLKKEGYEVIVASDGESGLAAAVSKQPDLILLDIRLPKIGGIEVCRKIKSDVSTKKIPIVFLTASQAKGVAEMVKTHGAEDFIIKPFEPAELLAKVRQYLK